VAAYVGSFDSGGVRGRHHGGHEMEFVGRASIKLVGIDWGGRLEPTWVGIDVGKC